jgi:hypothetical protein
MCALADLFLSRQPFPAKFAFCVLERFLSKPSRNLRRIGETTADAFDLGQSRF